MSWKPISGKSYLPGQSEGGKKIRFYRIPGIPGGFREERNEGIGGERKAHCLTKV